MPIIKSAGVLHLVSELKAASSSRRVDVRAAKAAERRNAILKAALDEFSERGLRLDDVARRAGVAKGTIYLYFKDKEALFQELVRFQIGPVVGALEAVLASDLPLAVIVEQVQPCPLLLRSLPK